eukprot:6206403-Pleurochrysis_carterae.AAC.2
MKFFCAETHWQRDARHEGGGASERMRPMTLATRRRTPHVRERARGIRNTGMKWVHGRQTQRESRGLELSRTQREDAPRSPARLHSRLNSETMDLNCLSAPSIVLASLHPPAPNSPRTWKIGFLP